MAVFAKAGVSLQTAGWKPMLLSMYAAGVASVRVLAALLLVTAGGT